MTKIRTNSAPFWYVVHTAPSSRSSPRSVRSHCLRRPPPATEILLTVVETRTATPNQLSAFRTNVNSLRNSPLLREHLHPVDLIGRTQQQPSRRNVNAMHRNYGNCWAGGTARTVRPPHSPPSARSHTRPHPFKCPFPNQTQSTRLVIYPSANLNLMPSESTSIPAALPRIFVRELFRRILRRMPI